MNREERRNLKSQGVSKETLEKLNKYDQPCTLLEVVKISRAIAEDVANSSMEEYRRRSSSTIIALTLQLEILKNIVVSNNLITEEEFQNRYRAEAKIFEEKQREYIAAMRQAESESLNDMETADINTVGMTSLKNTDLEVTVERD